MKPFEENKEIQFIRCINLLNRFIELTKDTEFVEFSDIARKILNDIYEEESLRRIVLYAFIGLGKEKLKVVFSEIKKSYLIQIKSILEDVIANETI